MDKATVCNVKGVGHIDENTEDYHPRQQIQTVSQLYGAF